MNYEELLTKAYGEVEVSPDAKKNGCGRFEILKVEGHFQGTRTVVTNFCAVADCLRRECEHLAKFLFKELATSGYVDCDRMILDRKINSKVINEKIEKYAREFVFCKACEKPDTELVEESGKLYLRCLACGKKQEVHRI